MTCKSAPDSSRWVAKAVSQRMRVDVFVDSRPLGCLLHCVEYDPGIDRDFSALTGIFAWKQIGFWHGADGTELTIGEKVGLVLSDVFRP